ncbi:MAG: SLBB domain-containing protein [Nitrospira sp.]|nr:SLBB domain-containing protein [Nitrospira sp.]MEB2338658.1 SLBB domain-containing protein [Nitrospirales bacterium]QOJ34738.1 MAG: SLBB domain-containing protein [Nitrospira sp.]
MAQPVVFRPRRHPRPLPGRWVRGLVWVLIASMVLPPSLLAQNLTPQTAPPGLMQTLPPGTAVPGMTPGGFLAPGIGGTLGQAIVTNPTALQPIVPAQTPCPLPLPPDLTSKGTVPNLNDYWPVEPSSLLPSSIEQRMKQEQEERDRRQEKIQADKEKLSIEYQVQTEREKKGVAQLPFGQGMVPGVPTQPGQTPPQPAGQPGLQPGGGRPLPEKKAFTAELLRQQDFSVEEAFAEFSVLHGVKSRLRQFGYDFFDAQANTFSPVQDIPVGPDFVVGPQDSLAVHIWNVPDPNFNRSFIVPVERDGMIVIPQVGAIPVGGQTFSQAERTIRARLGNLLKRFELHVSMARIRTIKVFVVGEVIRPGAYEMSALATTSNALYAACGPARSGSLRQVKVLRDGATVAELDLYDFFLRGDRRSDQRLQSGDVVLVPPLGPVVAVSGSIKRPAIYEVKPGVRLTELLDLAGGLTPLSDRQRCHLFRLDPERGRIMVDVDLVGALASQGHEKSRPGVAGGDPIILDGDYVRIGILPTQITNVVSLVGAVKSPGPYEYRPGMKVKDLLIHDQLTMDAYADRAEIVRTDPVTYQTRVIQFSPKALLEGNDAENHLLQRLDQVVVATQQRPPNLVLVEGEVKRPGYFTIMMGERLSSVLKRAGGVTPNAFPAGLVLTRESVKLRQQAELERFVASERQRLTAQSAGVAAGATGVGPAAALAGPGGLAEQQVLSLRLQQLEAAASRLELGRVVIRMESIEQLEGSEDDIILEARDRITMPTPSQTVSIIGSVKNPSTVVHRPNLSLDDYLRQAGGLTEDANRKEMYVMRANGTTDSVYLAVKDVRAGDTIVVPQKIEARTPQLALWQTVASIIGSVALTAAGIAVVGR